MANPNGKVWFITGASRGFGREWTMAALARGDRVAATARKLDTLKDLVDKYGDALLPLELDVTNKAGCENAIQKAHAQFGRLDVVINNAGYGHFGMLEEATEAEARAQFETNVFGALWVTQAAIPILRAQKSGHILQVSSIGGITAFPGLGLYHASKWALEGMSQALAGELAPFGVKVTLIEPGGYETDWGGASAVHSPEIAAYADLRARLNEMRKHMGKRGDPKATGQAVLEIVDAKEPPLRVFFGETPIEIAKADYAKRIETWEKWDSLSKRAHH